MLTIADVQRGFEPAILERGRRYAAGGAVISLDVMREEPGFVRLFGRVKGSAEEPYGVLVTWEAGRFEGSCTCPYAANCKHAAALALTHIKSRSGLAAGHAPAAGASWQAQLAPLLGGFRKTQLVDEQLESFSYRLQVAPAPGPAWRRPDALYVLAGHGAGADFSPMPWSAFQDDYALTPVDRLLTELLAPVIHRGGLSRTSRRTDPSWLPVPESLTAEALKLLALAPRVEDEGGAPLRLRADAPIAMALRYERDDDRIRLTPVAQGPEDALELAGLRIVGEPRPWALAGGVFHPLASAPPPGFQGSGPIVVPEADRARFEREFLPPLALSGGLTGPDAPETPRVVEEAPQAQLLLAEEEGRLVGRLGFVYIGQRVESGEAIELVGPPTGPWSRRDRRQEASLAATVQRQLHWSKRAARFVLEGDEALDFLVKTLPKLQKLGIEALGREGLTAYQITTARARMSVSVSSGIDWFDVEAAASVGQAVIPWPALTEALAEKRRYVRLGTGGYAKLPKDWLSKQVGLLKSCGLDPSRLGDGVRLTRYQAPVADALLAEADTAETDAGWKHFIARLKSFGGVAETPVPEGFRGALRPYQHQGLSFLSFLRDHGLHGILADDMGLGKTVQASALLAANHATSGLPPSLVVAPTSVIANWAAELARFAPALRVLVLHGPQRDVARIDAHDVVITTYATARLDLEAHRQRTYHTLILDEAQAIKNPHAQTTRAMGLLQAQHRLCLTGTPIENNLFELWSQFNFLMPGMLGPERDFKARFASPIAYGDADARNALKTRVGPFILRRLKGDVAKDLPPRTDIITWCELPPAQRSAYDAVLASSQARVASALDQKGLEQSQITILDALLKLRQVCCHPRLLKLPETEKLPSAKLASFLELVAELVEGGHRALVFSQFTEMLAILKEALDAKGVRYEYLDGRTRNRQARVDAFNAGDTPVFLISLKAGGTGLNLTGADYVIHFDPWWNPAVEDQATDRAHRIGQTRHVFSYKLIAKDTVEEKLLALQEKKRELIRGVLEADELGKRLTRADLAFLFDL